MRAGSPPSGAPRDLSQICEVVRITRRMITGMLLSTAGAAAQAQALAPGGRAAAGAIDATGSRVQLQPALAGKRTLKLVRAEDMLILDVTLDGLFAQGRSLARSQPGQPGRLIIQHQPQAIADQAFQETQAQVLPTDSPVEPAPLPPKVAQARMAGPSWVVFRMPEGQSSFTAPSGGLLETILEACRAWPMVLEDTARPPPPEPALRMGVPGRAFGALQERLDHAHGALRAGLPARDRPVLDLAITAASLRVGRAIADGIRVRRPISEPELDDLVARSLGDHLGPARWRQTDRTLLLVSRAVEAAASSCAITLAQAETQPAPGRRRPVFIPVQPAQAAQPAPTTAAPAGAATATGRPPFRLPPLRPVQPEQPAPGQPAPEPRQPVRPIQPQQPARPLEPFRPQLPNPEPHAPSDGVTALEIPFRLFQSPLATAGWEHARRPVTHAGRTELWHTRLGARRPWGVDDRATEPLRAIWSWDYPETSPPDPPPPPWWALDGLDRRMLVKLTAGYNAPLQTGGPMIAGVPYTPRPALAKQLMLTALGGWLDLDGHWEQRPAGADIEAWSHKTAMARDYFVRVVYAGYLFPFGHAASLVKVTERKFETVGDGREAVLRQRYFIIVREPERSYPGPNQRYEGRDFPFQKVEILTRITPNLVAPADRQAFFPETATGDLLFEMAGTDGAGRRIAFRAPLFFLSELHNNAADIGAVGGAGIANLYATSKRNGKLRSQVGIGGAVLQFAPQTVGGDPNGDTNIPTDTVVFQGALATGATGAKQPVFYPRFAQADVLLSQIKHLLQTEKTPTVSFSQGYLAGGFNAGPGQVYLDILSDVSLPADPSKPTDKFAGLISPNLKPSAISRKLGVVAGDNHGADIQSGSFDPGKFLPDAKLLGFISLKEVLNTVGLDQAPKLYTHDLPDVLEVGFTIDQSNLSTPKELFVAGGASRLHIESKTVIPRKGGDPASTVTGRLDDFKVNLFGFIILKFDAIVFTVEPGKKTDVSVDLDPKNGVLFGGPLEFVNTLRALIPGDGFSDEPQLSVTPSGITAGYSLGLPTIAVGAMSLQNISFGAAFNLPFTGAPPSVRFNFAERHNPFNLTVSLYGGGGFVAITIDTGGVRELEACLEFGAQISIDLGVASGGVYIKGGFYFHWRDAPDKLVYFEGYVELGGHLCVLGLITASLVFHLGLAYEKAGSETRVFGQATLTVEIDIAFFSESVDVSVEKQFAGSHDPRFVDLIPDANTWRQYCDAFA